MQQDRTVGTGAQQKPRSAAVVGAKRHTAKRASRGQVTETVAERGGDSHENILWVTVRIGDGLPGTEE